MAISMSRRTLVRTSAPMAAAMAWTGNRPALAQPASPPSGRGAGSLLRLSANENPYGPSESAKQAMIADLENGWMYATGEIRVLTELIAAREGVTPDHVLITEGSAEVLRIAALVHASRGKQMIAAAPTFEQAPAYAVQTGGEMVWVPVDRNMTHDLTSMEARIGPDTGLIYICNPNNPTATMLDADALRGFIDAVSDRAMVLVDEAYIDLVDDPGKNAMIDRVKAGKNVIVSRTFSKIHGMAGLRLGFAIASPEIVKKVQGYKMSVQNRMGLLAGIASYQDSAFMNFSRAKIREAMTMTMAVLDELGLPYTRSQANFLMFDTGKPMRAFMMAMRDKGVAVGRPFAPFDTWCRVSMGRVEQMPQFLDAMRSHFKKA